MAVFAFLPKIFVMLGGLRLRNPICKHAVFAYTMLSLRFFSSTVSIRLKIQYYAKAIGDKLGFDKGGNGEYTHVINIKTNAFHYSGI